MKTIYVIGANGFIGRVLSQMLLNEGFEVSSYLRSSGEFSLNEPRYGTIDDQMRVVINLAGAWNNVTLEQMEEANLNGPLQILNSESLKTSKTLWIQASSYYQLYERIYGIPKNDYSQSKASLSKKLEELSGENLKVIDMFLPHVIGPSEPEFRLFANLARAHLENRVLDLSSGMSVLPILDVRDLVRQIIEVVKLNINWESIKNHGELFPSVAKIDKLNVLILECIGIKAERCNFGGLADRKNEFLDEKTLANYYSVNNQLRSLKNSFDDQCSYLDGKYFFEKKRNSREMRR